MSSENEAIDLRDVTKTYRVRVGRARVREMIPAPFDRRVQRWFPRWWARDSFNALEDISLVVEPGDSIGVVGPNGAGKTTLLKIIAGVIAPTKGVAIARGRVAALIDVLVGFHPELTGVENAYLLGAMFGVGRRMMAPRIESVFDFAEIGDDLAETPVKRYSAGMMSRLGFAIVASVEASILLIDEVLAVGDAAFQRKCIQWLDDYQRGKGTLVFVSHNLGLVRSMTDRCLWLDRGRLVDAGSTGQLLGRYAKAMEFRDFEGALSHDGGHDAVGKHVVGRGLHRWGAGGARVEEVHVLEATRGVELTITYRADAGMEDGLFCVGFIDEFERELGAATSPGMRLDPDGGTVVCSISPVPLRPGIYFPVIGIVSGDGRVHDRWRLDRALVIESNGLVDLTDFGAVEIASSWHLEDAAGPGQ